MSDPKFILNKGYFIAAVIGAVLVNLVTNMMLSGRLYVSVGLLMCKVPFFIFMLFNHFYAFHKFSKIGSGKSVFGTGLNIFNVSLLNHGLNF